MKMTISQPPVEFVPQERLIEMISNTNGLFFSVRFIKRTNGQERFMLCMTGVTKHLVGGSLRFDPKSKGLIGVFDIVKRQYRFISIERLFELTFRGVTYLAIKSDV